MPYGLFFREGTGIRSGGRAAWLKIWGTLCAIFDVDGQRSRMMATGCALVVREQLLHPETRDAGKEFK